MFDVAVRERRLDTGRIRIAIAVIARETLDQVVNFCGKLGVSPERIGIDHSGHPDNEFNFLPPQPFRVNLQFLKRPAVVLVAAISVLFLLNVTLAFHRMDRRISYLSIELAKARLEAQATDKLRAQLTRSEAEARVLAEARSQPGPLEVLNSLTRLLPDDVWLFQFEFRDKTVQIAGLSPSSADLIDRLEKSDEFSNPKFKAPVIRAGKDGGDRFEIGFELRPGLIR
jgi:general secretion pathway protein L